MFSDIAWGLYFDNGAFKIGNFQNYVFHYSYTIKGVIFAHYKPNEMLTHFAGVYWSTMWTLQFLPDFHGKFQFL